MRSSSKIWPSGRAPGHRRFFASSVLSALSRAMLAPVLLSVFVVGASLVVGASPAKANFQQFVNGVWAEASQVGVSRATFDRAFNGVTPNTKIIRSSNNQSEFVKPIWEYLSTATSNARVENGRKNLARYGAVLEQIRARFGVEPHVVLAVWGMETNYGSYMGSHYTIRSLATLAYQGRRQNFYRKELINALRILEQGHTTQDRMIGSWAGAMGHTQFMPSSFLAYAADYEGDGRSDIWNNIPDALASTANYLSRFGWRAGETWGYEVVLPRGFDYSLADETTKRSIADWSGFGVARVNNRAFPRPADQATLYMPAGANGPAFLLLPNFRVIKRYNNANAYALAVGHLADRIIGGGRFVQSWPVNELPLKRSERRELQVLLLRNGYDVGEPDGKVGPKTRAAIRAYQSRRGLAADGYASAALLNRLRSGS
jgi:membrane-bound lytic murein transglycosylase B